jgi:two-component sensor histidine kinase
VAEAQETAELKSKIDDETKEAVRASSEAVSAIARTNQELLASKDEGFTSIALCFFSIHLLPRQS